MFDKFTESSRKVMGYARRICVRAGGDYMNPGHILLALLEAPDSLVLKVLIECNVDARELAFSLREVPGIYEAKIPNENPQIPFSASAKKMVELALEEADSLGNNYIGTEHLLLGLARLPHDSRDEQEGFIGNYVWIQHGTPHEALRKAVRKIQGESSGLSPESIYQYEPSEPLVLLINPGAATVEEVGDVLSDISQVFRLMGGSGISFTPTGTKSSEVV